MIKENTVFIVGAGGSKPYGFPTGFELREKIINNFDNFPHHFKVPEDKGILINSKLFLRRFNESGIFSIDKFIAFNPEYKDVGKIAISWEILKAESQSRFLIDSELFEIENRRYDWYSFLYNRLIDDIVINEESYREFAKNKLSIITFNYDRSLDWYIYNCFSNTFNERIFFENRCTELVPFPFIHLYGAAKLPWQADVGKEEYLDYQKGFGLNEIGINNIKKMRNSLKLIYEERESNGDAGRVKEILAKANKIFFLGFGYAKENLDIIGIPDSIKDKKVYGTAKDYSETEIKSTLHKLSPDIKSEINHISPIKKLNGFAKHGIKLVPTDILTLLREYL